MFTEIPVSGRYRPRSKPRPSNNARQHRLLQRGSVVPSGTTGIIVVVLTLTRIIKSVVTGQAPVILELRNTPGKTHYPRWYTHISQLTQFMPPPETYKSEIGSQSTMCQVHTGAYVSLLTPGETHACHPRKTTTCILHVVSITTHTHDRLN